MDVRLSPEQRALHDSAAQVANRLGPHAVGELDDRERIAKLDAAVAAAGWRELRTATDHGAPWASGVEVGIVAEELGRGLADVPFLGPTLAAELRRLAGAPPATSPETVAFRPDLSAPAWADPGADVRSGAQGPEHADAPERDRAAMAVAPTDAGKGAESVSGGRPGVVAVDALGASSALVLVPTPGGAALGQVDVPDATPDSHARVDLTRPTVALRQPAPAVLVPDQARALTGDDLTRWMALGLAATCADLVGVMQGAVDLASAYARERRQFGRPVGSFQAVQHLLADALVATEGSRSATLHATWAVDALPANDALAAAAVAKAYCARAARMVCETAIQVHGGIGNTWECLAHVHLRRALLSTDILGGVGPNLRRVLDHRGISRADDGVGRDAGIGDGIGGGRGLR